MHIQMTGGSIAVKNPSQFLNWLETYGADKIILGADCLDQKIAIQGWQEESDKEVLAFIKDYVTKGISYVICTDIAKDGMLQGPSFDLYETILSTVNPVKLIASGGISTFDELPKLADLGCEGVIIGKAIYEGNISFKTIRNLSTKPFIMMLAKRIIPCLDIKNGRTVKGVNFLNLRDAGDPVALAKQYAENGADELVFLDISATLESRSTTIDMVRKVAEQIDIPFTVGGGVST